MSSTPMNVTRDVIVDLLPLYLAGEVSPDTRALVDAYLATDPALAATARGAGAVDFGGAPAPAPDLELRSLRRTRSLLARQRWLFALAVAFTAVGLSTAISLSDGRVTGIHLVLFDHPRPLGACLVAAAVCWAGYAALRRSLRE